MAELDRQIAARAAVLEAQAGSDRAKFLRLLRSDSAVEGPEPTSCHQTQSSGSP